MENTIYDLIKKDLNDFKNQFGEEALKQIMKSGNLPLRVETKEKIKKTNPQIIHVH